jgi:hypothetical protein
MEERERTLIVLLSMHRCGSSLTAHILQQLGMSLGPFGLNPGDAASNPYGHFESIPFLNLNRRVQNLAYGFKDDLPESRQTSARFIETKGEWDDGMHIPADLLDEGRSLVRALVDSGRISGFKDPRTVLTWPFWQRVLADFPQVRVIPFGLVRSPHEIAMSMVTRRKGWRGYWTTLDVISVHLRRLKRILDSSVDAAPTICFGSPSYLKTLEAAVLHCGLNWCTGTVLDLFDGSAVHQKQAAVAHEAQEFFEALCADQAGSQELASNDAQLERDARFVEELRLEQWNTQARNLDESRDESRRMSLRVSEVEHLYRELEQRYRELEAQYRHLEHHYTGLEDQHRELNKHYNGLEDQHRDLALHYKELERQLSELGAGNSPISDPEAKIAAKLQSTADRLSAAVQARAELAARLSDMERRLIEAQEREIGAWHRNEQLRNRLERFESHPLLGPMLRGRRRIRRVIHSLPARLAPNGHAADQDHTRN